MAHTALPTSDLSDRISMFWSVPRSGRQGTAFFEFYPDSCANLIFRLSSSGARLVLMGPATEKAAVERDQAAEYFGVRFRVGQVPHLADVRAAELTDAHVDLARLGTESIDGLGERLWALPDLAARQRLLEKLLRGDTAPLHDERCRRAARLLELRGGQLRIDELADGLGIHPRSLERLFVDQLGMSPKRLTRLVRLRALMGRLGSRRYRSLAELALECGYADQAHMIRIFKELTGLRPSEEGLGTSPRPADEGKARVVHRYRRAA